MPPTYDTTSVPGFRILTGSNAVSDIDAGFLALGEDIAAALTPETPHIVGAGGEPAFQNAWSANIGDNVRFYRHLGRCYLDGAAVHSGASSAVIFTLPAGYRPDVLRFSFAYISAGAAAELDIAPDGTVKTNLPQDYVVFDGISFRLP